MFSHALRYFASQQSLVCGGQVTIALCELCGTVYWMTVDEMQLIEDKGEAEVMDLFVNGEWDELDKPLHEGGIVIRQYRRIEQ